MKETIKNIIYLARRFKLATTLNMMGLVVAFAAFYILMTQVIYQGSYNHSIEDYERLYRMESDFTYNEWEYTNLVCIPFTAPLDSMPEVESYSLSYNPGIESYIIQRFQKDGKEVKYKVGEGNNTVVSTLTSHKLNGTLEWTDSDQKGAIIPESIAKEYFGTADATGDSMLMVYPDLVYPIEVRGVYKDFPANCDLGNRIYFKMRDSHSLELASGYECIVKFKTVPKDMKAFAQKLKQAIIDYMSKELKKSGMEDKIAVTVEELKQTNYRFTPLKNSYFEHESFSLGNRGFRLMYHFLWLTCLLVIVIAAINFLNFTLAESPMRIRGLNTRLVLGATRHSLRRGLISEGIVTSLAACVIALIVCRLSQMIPVVIKLTEGDLTLQSNWMLIMIMLALAIVVGIVATAYPGNYATSIPPAMALKGDFGLTPQGIRLRKILTGTQIGISMLMVIYLGCLYQQSHYIFNSEYGYDRESVMLAELPLPEDYNYNAVNDSLYQDVLQLPSIEKVSFSDSQLGQKDGHGIVWTTQHDETFKYSLMHVSRDYLSTMGLQVIEGRDFAAGDTLAAIINQATRDRWPWLKVGTAISTGISDEEPDSAVVVGVCENIRYGTARIDNNQPFFIVFKQGYPYLSNINIRVAPHSDHKAIQQQVNNLLAQKCHSPNVQAHYFDTMLEQTYKNELRYTNQVVIICLICLIITLIGVFCLTLFETEYRRKEIGIRKVMGARTGEIVWMLCRHYVLYILIGFAIAAPIAGCLGYFTLNRYFKVHAEINWWIILPAALLIVGGIVLGAVALQSWRSSRENPVNSIKND